MNSMVIDLMGIYVPTFGVLMVLVFTVMFFLCQVLDILDIFPLFWHRGLIQVSIFVLLMGGALLLMFGTETALPPLSLVYFNLEHFF